LSFAASARRDRVAVAPRFPRFLWVFGQPLDEFFGRYALIPAEGHLAIGEELDADRLVLDGGAG
jgi:hypothetical protein